MRKIFKILFILICTLINYAVAAELGNQTTSTKDDAIRKVVDNYCENDFNGVADTRTTLVKYSNKRLEIEKKRDPELLGKVIAFEADPIMVVNSYKIQQIVISNNKSVATVAYDRIAKSKGHGLPGRKIIPEYVKQEIVEFHLINEKGQWLIIDPPLPRISKRSLMQYYKDYIESMEKWIHTDKSSAGQRHNYEAMVATLNFLESL